MSRKNEKDGSKIVIKRFEVIEGGHHGGSWKIAYADFVTAMMAFFLVMWLINATTEEQRRGIASFFNPMAMQQDAPPPVDSVVSPNVMPLSSAPPPALIKDKERATGNQPAQRRDSGEREAPLLSDRAVVLHNNELKPGQPVVGPGKTTQDRDMEVARASATLRQIIQGDPALQPIQSQVTVSAGDDGLHIQIADSDHAPMFNLGSAVPNSYAVTLLKKIVPYLDHAAGHLSIAGYTDAAPFHVGQPGNWKLSSQRAVAVRDVLIAAGFPDSRLISVSGHADRDLFDPAHPLSPRNRRIVLILSSETPR